jgi:hypothetical protein
MLYTAMLHADPDSSTRFCTYCDNNSFAICDRWINETYDSHTYVIDCPHMHIIFEL